MTDDSYDVIVVGAGLAGLCCAGELALQGVRPLLICETKEVAAALSHRTIAGNTAICQVPTVQYGWPGPGPGGGGWWTSLVRRLNLDINVPHGVGPVNYKVAFEGVPGLVEMPQGLFSAKSVSALIRRLLPGDDSLFNEIERLFDLGFRIPSDELLDMHNVPLADWLESHKVAPEAEHIFMILTNAMYATWGTLDYTRQHASVFGAFGGFRSCWAAEAGYVFVYPNNREGLGIPLAQGIEAHGGTVWRGRKVQRILVDNGRAGTVVLADGTEVRAPRIALATGAERIPEILEVVPPEVDRAVQSMKSHAHKDFTFWGVAGEPVAAADNNGWLGVLNMEGRLHWQAALHSLTPWSVEPGKQLFMAALAVPEQDLPNHPDEENFFKFLTDQIDFFNPGFKDALETTDRMTHKPGHLWFDHVFVGDKVPRTTDSLDNVWFVGAGSIPISGMWMEAAASGGMLGARDIVAAMKAGTS